MKVVIPGGTGQIGTLLARYLHREGHTVVVITRRPEPTPWRTVGWDGQTVGDWAQELEDADAVINLAGRSVNCRYNAENRRAILDSRVNSVRAVGNAIAQAKRPPRVWLQASTATIYAHRYDAPNGEENGLLGGSEPDSPDTWRFSIDVAQAWEAALNEAVTPGIRKIAMRSAITMSPDRGGAFDVLLSLVRHGLGGTIGDGHQYVSWIHEQDFVRAVLFLIEQPELTGPVNISAPHPLSNAEFMRDLRQAWRIGYGLPASGFLLELGAALMQTETELVLKSRRVTPDRLLDSGFSFLFSTWPEAVRDLCAHWRTGPAHQ